MDLNTQLLPHDTRVMFEFLSSSEAMKATGATLMGGTALTLLIGHRLSEDLDFFYFEKKLPVEVDNLIRMLKKTHSVHSTLTSSQISQARINGYNIEDYIREYLIDGVKVSFGVMSKGGTSRNHYFKNTSVIDYQAAFNIVDLDSLFKSKAVVLSDRVKSRDLFDLMVLIRDHGYTVKDIIDSIIMVDDKDEQQAHAALEILIGNVPLDSNDPGFNSIKLDVSIDEIYIFFEEEVNKYEEMLVKAAFDP